jgi:hypothetical protein
MNEVEDEVDHEDVEVHCDEISEADKPKFEGG